MAFDVKKTVDEVVTKAKNDPKFMEKLQKDPEKTIEGLIGVDIPDGAVDKVLAGVKGKITLDKVSGIMDMIKK